MRVLEGKSVFSGIAIGKISILQKADTSVKRTKVENTDLPSNTFITPILLIKDYGITV